MSDTKGITRRDFLVITGASSLLGCTEKPGRRLIPYGIPPDDLVPGVSRYYRSVCRECPAACGLSVRTREGRAVKLEGNPEHPINQGALCMRGQAAIEGLYDPERLGEPLVKDASGALVAAPWDQAEEAFSKGIEQALASGRRIYVLTRRENGSLGELFHSWLAAVGQDARQVVAFDLTTPAHLRSATELCFGTTALPRYDISRAKTLLSIGDDFLEREGSQVELARGLAAMREGTRSGDGRFVYVGPRLSLTAAAADEWLSVRPGSELQLVLGLCRIALEGAPGRASLDREMMASLRSSLAPYSVDAVARATGLEAKDVELLGREVIRARPSLCLGPGEVVAGDNAVALAVAVNLLNFLGGSVGETVQFLEEPQRRPGATDVEAFLRAAAAGEVGALIVHHANPLGYGLASKRLAEVWPRIPFVVAFTDRQNETTRASHLALADHHFLEAWGDDVSRPGITGIQQPAMSPLRNTRAAADVLFGVARKLGKTTGLSEGDWAALIRSKYSASDIERGGVFRPTAPRPVTLVKNPLTKVELREPTLAGPKDGLLLCAFPSLKDAAGLPSPSSLVQEIPEPVTTISWSGWVELHPETARRLGVATGDVVALESEAGRAELPAYVFPGVRAEVAAVPAAYVWPLTGEGPLPSASLGPRVLLAKTGRKATLPRAQGSLAEQGRDLVREVSSKSPVLPLAHPLRSMVPDHPHPERRWGMAIDLDRCTGCSACVAACYTENNIPVVGADEVARGRSMSWLRIDQSISTGPGRRPRLRSLPVMCQHCENAPCETVCPTYATYHTKDGLNAQIYNRCVGTRYCANNCPYNARRFNWWDYAHPEPTNLGLNPDVSVRERGVMEKCTFCVQRIRGVKEDAKMEGRAVRDGEVVPACAQACPTQAIVFGDLNDPKSKVSQLAADPRGYRLLEHLNTGPGVVYLARVRREPRR